MDNRGGKRAGAGRPAGISTKILERQSCAAKMCEHLGGDEGWKHIYSLAEKKKDYRTMLEIKKYWTDKRDGKAPQAINLQADKQIVVQYKLDPPTRDVVMPEKPAV